jgi:tellurite resistance protein TehA-like permease
MLARLDARVEGLSSSYFALVMATGIVSIGAHLIGVEVVDVVLFAINIAAYLALWGLTALRLARHRPAFISDLTDHQRGAGFLTMVAGTCVPARR